MCVCVYVYLYIYIYIPQWRSTIDIFSVGLIPSVYIWSIDISNYNCMQKIN